MTTIYHGHYGGWTQSKAAAIGAARKGTREDGGGVEERILAHEVGAVGLSALLDALNGKLDLGQGKLVATVRLGRVIPTSST